MRDLALAAALLLGIVALSIRTAHGSYLYVESAVFLHNLLGPRPLLVKIFDPTANELVGYQARELSYFFNWIDAKAIYACTRSGYPHFFSLVYIVGICLIAAFNVVYARRRFGKGFTRAAVFLSALFLSAPAVFLSNNFLRNSKILAATALFFLLWRVTALVSNPIAGASRARLARLAAGIAALGAVMSLADEQGVFLLALCLVFSAAACLAKPRGERAEPACVSAGIFAALAFYAFYDLYLGPKIIVALGNGLSAYRYQRMDVGSALLNGSNLREAWGLLMDTLGFQFGSLDFLMHSSSGNRLASHYPLSMLTAAALLSGLALPLLARKLGSRQRLAPAAAFPLGGALASCAALVVMFAVMIQRHPPILWESVRRGYYWVPCSALILVAATFSAGYWSKRIDARVIEGLLLALVVLNLRELPAHRRFLEQGLQQIFIDESGALRECLRRPEVPLPDFKLSPSSALWCADYRESVSGR